MIDALVKDDAETAMAVMENHLEAVANIADFNTLHLRWHDEEVRLYAFDVLALDSEDLRSLPLSMRKSSRVYWRAGRTGFSSAR